MLRIAICDDDAIFAGKLEMTVRQESQNLGIRVETDVFSDGEALVTDMKKGYQYEIIFIDIEMKYMNGIDAARNIRKLDQVVLLIYVSGYEQYFKELFEVEPFRFLSKPLDKKNFADIFVKLANALEKRKTFITLILIRKSAKLQQKISYTLRAAIE